MPMPVWLKCLLAGVSLKAVLLTGGGAIYFALSSAGGADVRRFILDRVDSALKSDKTLSKEQRAEYRKHYRRLKGKVAEGWLPSEYGVISRLIAYAGSCDATSAAKTVGATASSWFGSVAEFLERQFLFTMDSVVPPKYADHH